MLLIWQNNLGKSTSLFAKGGKFHVYKPKKYIPEEVLTTIYKLVETRTKVATRPISALKVELKVLDIAYDPAYGVFLKKMLKQLIDDNEMLMIIHLIWHLNF